MIRGLDVRRKGREWRRCQMASESNEAATDYFMYSTDLEYALYAIHRIRTYRLI